MPKDTCKVADCTKHIKRAGFCYAHYMKNWRYGTPTPEHPKRHQDLAGQRFGELVVVDRTTDGFWICRCDCGNETKVRTGCLNRGSTQRCGSGQHRERNAVGYGAAHERVRRQRGNASEYKCVDCGEPAQHWSYDHADPGELVSVASQTKGITYSTDPTHYEPRCVPCHKTADLARLK